MKLGTKLIMAFIAVTIVPIGAILSLTWSTVEARFEEEFAEHLDNVTEGISDELKQIGDNLINKVEELAQSEQVERILVDMVRGSLDRRAMIPEAAKWMKAWDFDMLSLLDGSGIVMSSGHLPARFGSKDEESIRNLSDSPLKPVIRQVQVLRGGIIETVFAVTVVGQRQFNEAEVIVVAGKLLDKKFVTSLEKLSSSRIIIVDQNENVVASGLGVLGVDGNAWKEEEGITYRRIALAAHNGRKDALAYVIAGVSKKKLMAAQKRILFTSFGAAIVGVIISWLLGMLISRKITSPVLALVQGAKQIARGEWQHRIDKIYSGEIGELVASFNSMADELDVYQHKLVRAERVAAWQEIARRIAHEIKNPLSPIQMSIETLKKAYSTNHPDFKEIFEESTNAILEEVGVVKRIVSEFSEFARMPKPTITKQNLNLVVESMVKLYRNEEGGERIDYHSEKDNLQVAIDREQISRVLANLLSNALWATRDKGRVVVRTNGDSNQVRLEVEDGGQGMSEEVLARVFTPYYTTRRNGTGLGLAIVQRIVEDHQATMEVRSAEKVGTFIQIIFSLKNLQ
jgi:signal transduction histidine kinase